MGWKPPMREPRTTIQRGREKITSPRSLCPRKKRFLIRDSGKPWDALSAGVRRVTSRSPVDMGQKRVANGTVTTGCINGIVLFRKLRTAKPLKPSLHVFPPLRAQASKQYEGKVAPWCFLRPPYAGAKSLG